MANNQTRAIQRSIVQVAVAPDGEFILLYALADDGTLWRHRSHSYPMPKGTPYWTQIEPLPDKK